MNHEEELIRAFIIPARRARYLQFVASPKRRPKLIRELAHFRHLDERYVRTILPRQRHAADIASLLKQMGAPATCWVISANSEIDGKEMLLVDALKEVVGYEMGTFLSCVPGRLAYFEDEDGCWILKRP